MVRRPFRKGRVAIAGANQNVMAIHNLVALAIREAGAQSTPGAETQYYATKDETGQPPATR